MFGFGKSKEKELKVSGRVKITIEDNKGEHSRVVEADEFILAFSRKTDEKKKGLSVQVCSSPIMTMIVAENLKETAMKHILESKQGLDGLLANILGGEHNCDECPAREECQADKAES